MNDLLFYALLSALLYYFFIYLPAQKKLPATPPSLSVNTQQTQTDTIIRNEEPGPSDTLNCPGPQFVEDPKELERLKKDIQQKEKTITDLNQSYEKLATKTKKEADNLKKDLKDKEQEIKELKTMEKDLAELLKEISELNKEL